jgi:hypothetical protein
VLDSLLPRGIERAAHRGRHLIQAQYIMQVEVFGRSFASALLGLRLGYTVPRTKDKSHDGRKSQARHG